MSTENHGFLAPTCVLEVNLKCCEECPRKVKNKLEKIKGVISIHMDKEEGLVTVSGEVDPSILMKAIEKAGKKPKLYYFERNPNYHQHDQDSRRPHGTKGKKVKKEMNQHQYHGSDFDPNSGHAPQFNGHRPRAPALPSPNGMYSGYHYPPVHMNMQPGHGYFPTESAAPYYTPASPYGHERVHPPMYGRPPPQPFQYRAPYPPAMGYRDGGVGNDIIHTFKDDNYQSYCTIM